MRNYHGRYHAFSGGRQWRGKLCFYCGRSATCHDHKIPIARGGHSDAENLAPSCGNCNASKGPRTIEEFRTYAIVTGRIQNQYFAGEEKREPIRDFLAVGSPEFKASLTRHNISP